MSHDQASVTGALLQLARRARSAETPAVLGFVIVNESQQLLAYRQSALWIRDRGISALSGLPQVEHDAPYVQWLNAICESIPELQEGVLHLNANDLPEWLPQELCADWEDWLPTHVLLIPMLDRKGSNTGYWLLASEQPWEEHEAVLAQELADIYTHAWKIFDPRLKWRKQVSDWLGVGKRKRNLLIALGFLILFPVRLTVMVPAEVTPKDAFPVRAPLEGAIDIVHVRPNQQVNANQALFDLDTTGLRTRLSVSKKAYETAAEEYRQSAQLAVNNDEKGRFEMSMRKGRMEEKAAELNYSQEMFDRVQVKAPMAGVAVFSDASDWVGKAVTIGERVMQIADPSKVEITLRLPVADAIEIAPDAAVTLYLSNAPQFSYDAKLVYAAYRAEASIDAIVAYKLKAHFDAGETLPRLGLTGTARIHGKWVPFFYYVLRKPIGVLRQWVGL
jgi:Barrel-sandwich domain of CusB or HlyD membrane-fusion